MNKQKLILPICIVLGCVILGGFFYSSQVSKQNSIEQQQKIKTEEEARQQELKMELENLKLKQDECRDLSVGVMKKWNNVMGVTYDSDVWEECVVTFTDPETGKIETSPLRFMEDSK